MMRSRHGIALTVAVATGFGLVNYVAAQDINLSPSEVLDQSDSQPTTTQHTQPRHMQPRYTQSRLVVVAWSSASARSFMRSPQQRNLPALPRGSQGYLGIDVRDISDDRMPALKLHESRGAEIIHVDHDGPAGIAGLREHDVVLQMNGQVVEGEEQLRRMLRETPPGRGITLLLSRDGQQQAITAQMADRAAVEREAERQASQQRATDPEPAAPSGRGYGMGNGFLGGAPIVSPASAPPITAPPDPHAHSFIGTVILGSSYTGAALELIGPQLAQFFGSQGGNGLLVRSVDPNSPAAAAGLRAGDVVVRANAVIIAGLSEWARLVRENKGHSLSIVIVRDKEEQTLVLIPDAKKRSSLEFQELPLDARSAYEQASGNPAIFLWMN